MTLDLPMITVDDIKSLGNKSKNRKMQLKTMFIKGYNQRVKIQLTKWEGDIYKSYI